MERHYLGVQRIVVNARSSLLAAAMRRRLVVRLPALALHRATAGALFGAHPRVRNHARHRRGQTRRQQQNQHPELAANTHDQDSEYGLLRKERNRLVGRQFEIGIHHAGTRCKEARGLQKEGRIV